MCELEGGDEGILFPENHTHPHPHAALWGCAPSRRTFSFHTVQSLSAFGDYTGSISKPCSLLMLQRRTGSHAVSYCPFWRNKKWPASRIPFSSSRTLCNRILQPSGISCIISGVNSSKVSTKSSSSS